MKTIALDFESYYDKECSIKTLGPLGYFSHPTFDAYMVSIVSDDGTNFVGHPKDFDWSLLENSIILSHNASFDQTLYLYGVSQKWWPEVDYAEWHCTADMCAALGLPRSLKGAAAEVFNETISKSTRDNMSGKRWESMDEDFKQEVSEYALKDSEWCLRLWQELSDRWSEREREISRVNRKISQRGLPLDQKALKEAQENISRELFETEQAIPWNGERPLLSRKAFDDECIKMGIEPPASLAQTDVDAQKWIKQHGHNYRWIRAVTNWRRINTIKKKLASFDVATMPDGRYYGGLMYYGAHTGRFSGSGGNLNLQNLSREEMFGVNMRRLIHAPKGRKLVVVDLSQIEVRTLCWLAGDKEMLDTIAKSEDIYEAFAIKFGLWSVDKGSMKQDPALRHAVKAAVLGSGYGSGPDKVAAMYNLPLKDAERMVSIYRRTMKKVTSYWSKIKQATRTAHATGSDLVFELPSGSTLNYGKLKMMRTAKGTQYVATPIRNGKRQPLKIWYGLQVENLSQKLARDVFCDHMVKLDEAGYEIILHVHDEFVVECDEEKAEEVLAEVTRIMSTAPEWIKDLPLSAEGKIMNYYQK